jgi:hypothetical protein
VPVLPAGKVGRTRAMELRAGFFLPAAPGAALPGPAPEVLIKVPIYEPYGKISRGAYSGKSSCYFQALSR